MGQALYRKYRSRSFDEVVGQEHITKTLQNSLKAGKISHAYLFTGPRGVGKTSVARILAHEVNGLAYKDDSLHLDIIEIDAASNRRIDEIRDLRDKVKIAPAAAKFKVYIIDEVHMLTKEAFNALLKTLEEPPAHCIFILATTEAHKLPETIISRTQRFEFHPIGPAAAAEHLADIARQEKIAIQPEALELLADFGGGSFRDSISYLDQLSSLGKKISPDDVRLILGLPAGKEIDSLLTTVGGGDLAAVLFKLKAIEQKGVSAPAAAAALSGRLRSLAQSNQIKDWQLKLLAELLTVSASDRSQEALEITLLQAASPFTSAKDSSAGPPEPNRASSKVINPSGKDTTDKSAESRFDTSLWGEVVELSKAEAASIYTALRLASPVYTNGRLTLYFKFPLHQKKLNLAKNRELVSKIIEGLCGETVQVEAVIDKAAPVPQSDSSGPDTAPVGMINNIFGTAEVLEA